MMLTATRLLRLSGVAVLVVAAASVADAAATPTTETFDQVGTDDFEVPADVCQVEITAFGAEGGGSANTEPVQGGLGGAATATVEVTPLEVLEVRVGGVGTAGNDVAGGAGGFNGGGDGGGSIFVEDGGGGGGGGASDVRQGGGALANRVVVAGGGGGGGADGNVDDGGQGGEGGGTSGTAGQDGGGGFMGGGGGGDEGTPAAGGAPGDFGATAGVSGTGGEGGNTDRSGGGGGGGGWFGGGGGGATAATDDGAGGGGGGSGFGPVGVVLQTGVQAGDGLVTITFDAEAETCPDEPVTPTPPSTSPAAAPIATEPAFTG
jgi:hypothetical protein